MFGQLTIDHFMTSVFRTLFQAIAAAGGLPSDDTPQGLWMHNLTKAGGPMLNQVINELAVMPLPLPGDDGGNGAQPPQSNVPGGVGGGAAAVQLRPATPEEQRYATELLTRLLDMGFMRQIGLANAAWPSCPTAKRR